jgi:hypothetical protein
MHVYYDFPPSKEHGDSLIVRNFFARMYLPNFSHSVWTAGNCAVCSTAQIVALWSLPCELLKLQSRVPLVERRKEVHVRVRVGWGGRSTFLEFKKRTWCPGVSFRTAKAVAFELVVWYCTPPLHLLYLHAVSSARVRTWRSSLAPESGGRGSKRSV